MSIPPLPAWQRCASDAVFADPGACEDRTTRFERTIRRRNAVEYAAGALVIALFGVPGAMALLRGEIAFALSFLLVVAGTGVVLWNLHRRGSNLARVPESNCRDHLRRQYERQRDALAAVPAWYIGPLLPGTIALYATVTAKVAAKAGWMTALSGIAGPAAITFGIFAAIALLNLWAARRLDREIRALADPAGAE